VYTRTVVRDERVLGACASDWWTSARARDGGLTRILAGHWSIWVNGIWRVTLRFADNDVELVDYQDYR
jgi:hypothetical protein